ncbi:MAG: OsmC family protein [Pseudomonadota bacterium]
MRRSPGSRPNLLHQTLEVLYRFALARQGYKVARGIDMVNVKIKAYRTINMTGKRETHARTLVNGRDLVSVIDEPEALGGTNQGINPTETVLGALMGCTTVIASRLFEREGLRWEDADYFIEAVFDRRGAALMEEVQVPFPTIKLTITGKSDATPEQVEKIAEDLGKYCPIAKMLRESGTVIEEDWRLDPL